jgi:hypothetical protein
VPVQVLSESGSSSRTRNFRTALVDDAVLTHDDTILSKLGTRASLETVAMAIPDGINDGA